MIDIVPGGAMLDTFVRRLPPQSTSHLCSVKRAICTFRFYVAVGNLLPTFALVTAADGRLHTVSFGGQGEMNDLLTMPC